jgi:biopolymer transport protein TolR
MTSISAVRPGRRIRIDVPRSRLSAAINVTPLVDVVLVLLIIFMVVTPLLERQLDVRVPPTRISASLPAEPQLVVVIDERDGLSIDGTPVSREAFVGAIAERLAERPTEARSVFFIAHDRSAYPTLVRAMDDAKSAGALKVGVVTD